MDRKGKVLLGRSWVAVWSADRVKNNAAAAVAAALVKKGFSSFAYCY